MKKREIVAACFLLAGLVLETLVYVVHGSEVVRGSGAIAIFFGIAIEIIGIAIYEDGKEDE